MDEGPSIHRVLEDGNHEAAASLICAGHDVHALDDDGQTALLVAVRRGAMNIVTLLLNAGADVHLQAPGTGGALHVAATGDGGDGGELVAVLAGAGCPIESRNDEGETALHVAAKCGACDAMRALLSRGADANASSKTRSSPLHLVCDLLFVNALACTRLLLNYGADESAINGDGLWPSMLLAYHDVEGESSGMFWSNEATSAIDAALSRARSDRVCDRRRWIVLLAACPRRGKRLAVSRNSPWISAALSVAGLEGSHAGLFRKVVEFL